MIALPPFSAAKTLRHYWLADHGLLRTVWTNFHKLDDDVWRHNHPSPARLAQLQAMGARSVLSLRGHHSLPAKIEAAACAELGLELRSVEMQATRLSIPSVFLDMLDAMRELPRPMVIHCKSGSDRTGLASAIYLHVFRDVPMDQARAQLAPRYAHNPFGRARILYRLLDAYSAAHDATGIGFEEWVRTQYDPAALSA
ncbi:tyrosine-protein phosphatase [Hasllibacter sp. MH4015]|uniref:tyrosine-protein phosphatase n=1 Tax=Hasllibacter sp. MH4015 TaxID=2854029 RepID=UPI001CD7117A|nr:tyrosine-protein phosphatase [Hasllibacter sp. MH4015]